MLPLLLLKIIAPVAILGAAWAHGYSKGSDSVQADWDQAKAAQAEVNLEAERMVRMAETRKFTAAKGAQDALTLNLGKARTDADAARAALASLLDAAPSPSPAASDPVAARRAVGSAATWDVLGECAREIQALAAVADGLEARLVGWQAWWAAVKP